MCESWNREETVDTFGRKQPQAFKNLYLLSQCEIGFYLFQYSAKHIWDHKLAHSTWNSWMIQNIVVDNCILYVSTTHKTTNTRTENKKKLFLLVNSLLVGEVCP